MVQIHSPRPLLLESTIYITRKFEERLVAGQEVERSNPPAPSIISLSIHIITRFLNCEFYFT